MMVISEKRWHGFEGDCGWAHTQIFVGQYKTTIHTYALCVLYNIILVTGKASNTGEKQMSLNLK